MNDTPLYNENLPRDRYACGEYNHSSRWMSYYHQLRLILATKGTTVLEVGPGHGWMAHILKDQGLAVTTVDVNPELKPDVVAGVDRLPFPDNSFDVVCAFEVLEHLPFETFIRNLSEMARASRGAVIISLPDHRRTLLNASLKLPFLPAVSLLIKVPSLKKHVFNGRHYWEIGKLGYPPSRIKREIEKAGLEIRQAFVPPDVPMNHYFVMKKQSRLP